MRPIGVSSSPDPAGFVYWDSSARTGGLLPRARTGTAGTADYVQILAPPRTSHDLCPNARARRAPSRALTVGHDASHTPPLAQGGLLFLASFCVASTLGQNRW